MKDKRKNLTDREGSCVNDQNDLLGVLSFVAFCGIFFHILIPLGYAKTTIVEKILQKSKRLCKLFDGVF